MSVVVTIGFYFGIQLYILLSPYLCFFPFCLLVDDASIKDH